MIKNLLVAAAMVVASVSLSQTAVAQTNGENTQEDNKVTICHRTNSVKNPYVKITVDVSAVDGEAGNSGEEPDHFGEHKGPLASSEEVAQRLKDEKVEWGDIIPPVEGSHEGLNWTAEGQAIYNNDCEYAQPEAPKKPVTPGTTLGDRSQVKAPAGGVSAGGGGAAGSIAASLFGLGSSLTAVAYGARRLRKNKQ